LHWTKRHKLYVKTTGRLDWYTLLFVTSALEKSERKGNQLSQESPGDCLVVDSVPTVLNFKNHPRNSIAAIILSTHRLLRSYHTDLF
jgi:hypothetical protein